MEPLLTDTALLRQLGEAFGLTQTALGQLLGLSRSMLSQVRTGHRRLPPAAYVALTHLVVALQAVAPLAVSAPADAPPAVAIAPADLPALGRHARACRATAARLALEQAALATRAAWATRRLAVLPVLAATVPALGAALASPDPGPDPGPDTGHTPGPRWLARFEAEAREALITSGPLAQARLALRRAALLHEVALTDRLLAGEALDAVVPPAGH